MWAARQPPSSPRPRRGVAQEGPDDEADGVVAQDATGRAGREDVRQVRLAGGGRHGDSCGGLQRASPAALRSAGRASPRLASPGSGLWSAGGGGGGGDRGDTWVVAAQSEFMASAGANLRQISLFIYMFETRSEKWRPRIARY